MQALGFADSPAEPRDCSDRHRVKSAIDDHFDAGDEGSGFGRGEEESGTDEFVGVAEAGCGGLAEDVEHAGFVEDLAVLFGGEETWDEGVDADVLVTPFAGEVASEIVDGGLRERIGEDAREGVRPEIEPRLIIEAARDSSMK